ncbi:hypothetical protein FRACYDRAFT_251841 [Fragilariopsis cylindrus CCMP1102]|uniref:Uncharacterized protein n=1 Tax=Fragilariopsis cylindrus CCMP1102 TaxID=635003 RepID=A0A1E7EMT2_9STRA|nr:hypothetical protein FRACYDRAFT_251841 [Fragilariopsis cylindrus CCMP1102]|eukprot:OEU07106.1 hypothetical protein FRACYDRAFT_251841 [Fragilariopsis cylindrus CCMP1102]
MVLSLTPKRTTTIAFIVVIVAAVSICRSVDGLSTNPSSSSSSSRSSRRHVIESLLGGVSTAAVLVGTGTGGGIDNTNMMAQAGEMDVDSFLQSGGVAMPMGVSGQAGKSKPITNIIFREDGIDISRNSKTGNVIAEILVQKAGTKQEEYNDENLMSVITSFSAPYPLATGMVYDVECRDSKTGDAAF